MTLEVIQRGQIEEELYRIRCKKRIEDGARFRGSDGHLLRKPERDGSPAKKTLCLASPDFDTVPENQLLVTEGNILSRRQYSEHPSNHLLDLDVVLPVCEWAHVFERVRALHEDDPILDSYTPEAMKAFVREMWSGNAG
jgi:hypothetical protein